MKIDDLEAEGIHVQRMQSRPYYRIEWGDSAVIQYNSSGDIRPTPYSSLMGHLAASTSSSVLLVGRSGKKVEG